MTLTQQTAPKRIQLRRTKGWRKPEGVVTVSRGTDWGNPFIVGAWLDTHFFIQDPMEITRDLAIALYRAYIDKPGWHQQIRHELGGKDLACWCRLDQACHADVLLEIAKCGSQIRRADGGCHGCHLDGAIGLPRPTSPTSKPYRTAAPPPADFWAQYEAARTHVAPNGENK